MAYDGQSLNNVPDAQPYPARVMAGRGLPWAVAARNANAWSTLQASQADRLGKLLAPYQRAAVVLCGGTGDIGEGDSAATVAADMAAYAAGARALGADRIIATTITPSTAFSGAQELVRVAANALIVAGAGTTYDAVVDLAALPQLANPNDGTYYADGTHWTNAGAQVAADALAPVVTAQVALL